MKTVIIASMELDGHAGASMFIATNKKERAAALKSLLYYEDELMYEFQNESKINEHTTEQWYTSDCGEMSLLIIEFSRYKDIEVEEFFTRTG